MDELTGSDASLTARTEAFVRAATPLPGLEPYTNYRTLRVQGRFDGLGLLEFLCARHPHIDPDQWSSALAQGRLRVDGRAADPADRVRGGNTITHVIPNTVEPRVNVEVRFLYEDRSLVALSKPAPLPVHPSGRYNRHTLTSLLRRAFEGLALKPVHRLDADTTGVILLAKDATTATALGRQFEARSVDKRYLARVVGQVGEGPITCTDPITDAPNDDGRREVDSQHGAPAQTIIQRRWAHGDDSLLEVIPKTGRTNQIRVHLAALGHPIVGDSAYGPNSTGREPMSGGDRLHLHAWTIAFSHPSTQERIELEAPPPAWSQPPPGAALL